MNTVSSTAAFLGGDRLPVDDAQHPGTRRRTARWARWPAPRDGAAVASSSNVPADVRSPTASLGTAKPSLRTRQMWMQIVSTTSNGSTATWSA